MSYGKLEEDLISEFSSEDNMEIINKLKEDLTNLHVAKYIVTEGEPYDKQVKDGFGCILYAKMTLFQNIIAQVDAATGVSHTYNEIKMRAVDTAKALQEIQLRPNDVILVSSRNNSELYDVIFACLFAGIVVCALDHELSKHDISQIISIVKPSVIMCEQDKINCVRNSLTDLQLNIEVICIGDPIAEESTSHNLLPAHSSSSGSECSLQSENDFEYYNKLFKSQAYSNYDSSCDTSIIHLRKCNQSNDYCGGVITPLRQLVSRIKAKAQTCSFAPTKVSNDSVTALLVVAYGHGGLPKIFRLSHANLLHQSSTLWNGYNPGDNVLCFNSLYQMIGRNIFLHATLNGATRIYTSQRFTKKLIFNIIGKYKPNRLVLSPYQLLEMTKYQSRNKYNLCCVSEILVGEQVLTGNLRHKLQALLPNAIINVWYGFTETGIIAMSSLAKYKNKSVGKIVTGVKMKVTDPDFGNDQNKTESGCLCVKMPTQFMGYLNEGDDYNFFEDHDFWINTLDIVHVDEDEFLFIDSCEKERIVHRSYEFSVSEIEKLLLNQKEIANAAVVVVEHPEDGDMPAAYVVLEKTSTWTVKEVWNYLNETWTSFKAVTAGIHIVKKLPKKEGNINKTYLAMKAEESYRKKEMIRTQRSKRRGLSYLSERRVVPFVSFLLGHLFAKQPQDPLRFLRMLLEDCIDFREGNCLPPLLFQRDHLEILGKSMIGEFGSLSSQQYETGIRSVATLPQYKTFKADKQLDKISINTFIQNVTEILTEELKQMLKCDDVQFDEEP